MRATLLALLAAAPLAGCGSTAPSQVTGNLTDTATDARGAHAGTFRAPGTSTAVNATDANATAADVNAADASEPASGANANTQGNTQ